MKKRNNYGFTLIELMITLVVAVIVLTVAVPSLQDMVTSNRVATEVNSLVATLNRARSEAIKRGESVKLCASNTCTGTGNWSDGWILFRDTDDDGVVDTGELITMSQAFDDSDTLSYKEDKLGGVAKPSVLFKGDGFAFEKGVFKLCVDGDTAAKYASSVYISATGRVRLSSDTDGSGIHDNGLATSTELSCP